MICNNDVTYADKWDNSKNRRYQEMAMEIARKSDCISHIPLGWAREVYFFLDLLERKYGIRYPTSTHMGYFYPKLTKMLSLLFIRPLTTLPYTIKRLFKDVFSEPSMYRKKLTPTRKSRVKETLFDCGGYFYGYQILWQIVYGYIYNWTNKPQIGLGQIKEKFGYLTVYYQAPQPIREEVDRYIKKLEHSLSSKGAYYKMEIKK